MAAAYVLIVSGVVILFCATDLNIPILYLIGAAALVCGLILAGLKSS